MDFANLNQENNYIGKKLNPIKKIYQVLYNYYGPQHWWPGESPFEIMVGAVLTQNTSWQNVKKAINNIKTRNLLYPQKLFKIPLHRLAQIIKPCGFYKLKARRLKNLLRFLMENYNGDVALLSNRNLKTAELREKLLEIKGIGPETADSILLYALNRPVFVVDAYTRRVFSRHNFFSEDEKYSTIQQLFTENLPVAVQIYNEYHALIVQLAKEFCKKTPNCQPCPLNNL